MNNELTLGLVRAYYDSWQGGERFDEARLRRVLHPQLSFVSPRSNKQEVGGFLEGLLRFNQTLRQRTLLQLVSVGNEAAALYDCELPSPVAHLRCGEFFRIEGERITAIRLVFDASRLPPVT